MENIQYSDSDIIAKVITGETALFEILIRRYNAYLYKTGRSYNYSHEDTQDLMQESFISAYLNLAKFENRASFKTWIIRIMLNHCWQKQQKLSYKNESRQEISEYSASMFVSPTDTQTAIMNKELNNVIENALKEVPENYRLVFTLREISGMNVAETAGAMNISETNVKVRLNRAKAMLRTQIEKSYSPEEIFEFNLIYCDAMVNRVMERIQKLKPVGVNT
jgi:RNA polymerase sigma factor (sigma-70 family)